MNKSFSFRLCKDFEQFRKSPKELVSYIFRHINVTDKDDGLLLSMTYGKIKCLLLVCEAISPSVGRVNTKSMYF